MAFEETVTVEAPAASLWRVVADVERWPEWTPSMRSVIRTDDGNLAVGSEARVRQPGLREAGWRVTALDPGRSFVWESTVAGVTSTAEHLVEEVGSGSRLTLRLDQKGPLAGLVRALYGRRIRRFLDLEARGLGAAAESAAGSGTGGD